MTDKTSTEELSHSLTEIMKKNCIQIAQADLLEPLQNLALLEKIAARDARAIGYVKGLKVLEIGPGRGYLLRRLRECGADVYASDLVENYLKRLSDFVEETAVFDIQDIKAPPEHWNSAFDLIVLTDVLEHLTHPQDALLVCGTLMKKSGRIYVRVPAHESLIQYSRTLGCPYVLVHLRTYDKPQLRRELNAAGFRCIGGPTHSYGSSRAPGRWLSRSSSFTNLIRHQIVNAQQEKVNASKLSSGFSPTGCSPSPLGTLISKLGLSTLVERTIHHLKTRRGEIWCLAEYSDHNDFGELKHLSK
jgi:2-polyprenyl-3-methyl-5-hydroxy-6-metoxy-1,4-benzoquinol methylase